ncbi:MAG: hypothetical protein ACI9JM_001452 [Halioglobus sp.]|jgi:hypothetical protein
MKNFLKWFGVAIAVVLLGIVAFLTSMRFHDGPIEIFSGGPFTSGELSSTPEDWRYLKDRETIEFQTMDPSTSRVVWLATYEGRLFIISGYMTTGYGKMWKKWPHYLDADDRVILRIDGKLYEQRLERIMEGLEVLPVLQEFGRKYGMQVDSSEVVTAGHAWMYEVVERN